MGLKVITAAAQVLTLAELRLHLRLDTIGGTHPDDDLIIAQLEAARGYCEHYTGRAIGSQTLELALDAFPDGAIALPKPIVTSITSLKYIDTNGVEQTMSSSDYTLDDYSVPNWLILDYSLTYPSTLPVANAVKVRYVTGAAPVGAVRAALLLMVGHLYENREAVNIGGVVTESPLAVRALLDTLKVYE